MFLHNYARYVKTTVHASNDAPGIRIFHGIVAIRFRCYYIDRDVAII